MSVPLIKALKDAFEEQQNCDITFNVAGEDIHAHKLILSIRSPVFKTMINNATAYVNGKILISDPSVTHKDFKTFLKFFYTDECRITRKNLEIMLHLGNMYDVPLLMEKCVNCVKKDINETNLLDYAEIGLLYSDQCSILSKCLKQIPKCFFNEAEQNSSSQLKFSLLKSSPALILKVVQDCMRVGEFNEDKLFEAVLDWAKNECTKNPETTTLKDVLKDILPFIKFDNLKPLTLASVVKENNLLEEKELLDSIVKSTLNESKESNVVEPKKNLLRKRYHGSIYDLPYPRVPDAPEDQRRQELRERLEQNRIQFQQQMQDILGIGNR